MKVVRKGGEELGLVGGVEIHYIYTVYNFGPYLGLFLSILSAVDLIYMYLFYFLFFKFLFFYYFFSFIFFSRHTKPAFGKESDASEM